LTDEASFTRQVWRSRHRVFVAMLAEQIDLHRRHRPILTSRQLVRADAAARGASPLRSKVNTVQRLS